MEMSDFLKCKIRHLPMFYLGILLGANPNKVSTWNPVIDKVERKLALWNAKVLSRAGRLVLIKVVLNNFPLYFLSIFKIPKKVAVKIVQLQRNFFWSINGSKKGLSLISWENTQKPRIYGGLAVGDIIIKNAALLFKWWWRFSDQSNALWKQIIWSNHYSQCENVDVVPTMDRIGDLWGQITSNKGYGNEILEVISKGMWRKVGDGSSVLFWEHKWLRETPLKDRFPRLYQISNQR